VNFAINWAIAWAVFHGMASVPLQGDLSIANDTIGTTFFLPFLTTLFASPAVRGHVRRGRVPAWPWGDGAWRRVPRRLVVRGALFGVVCVVLVGIPTAHALGAAGVTAMDLRGFLAFKALFAAVLAVVVTPFIARAALADG
jgi:hypothetical protein